MFLPRYRPLLIICLIILDIFIARSIVLAKTSNSDSADTVLGTRVEVSVAPTAVPSLTPTPSSTPTPTVTPIRTPASPTPIPPTQSSSQTKTPVSPGSGSLLDQLNAFRSSHGLSSVQSDSNTCNFATTRAQEISTSFDHSGFENRINSHTLPYSSYHEVTENIAMTDDPNGVIPMWIDSPGHNANMQKDTPYVCIMNFGNYYAYEGWRP